MTEETKAAAEPREPGAAGTRAAEGTIEIDAPPERVWRALTEAAELERWFPLEARVEPGEGGSIWMSWKNEWAGESEILAWDPARRLRISWGWPDATGHAQVTDYLLEGRGGRTLLRVVTSGFPLDPSWDDWVEGTRRGWRFELESLKHYLERHAGEDRQVIYLRRRVRLPREEVWARIFGPGGLDARSLGGKPFDDEPPLQYAVVVDDPPDALLRVSNEPCYLGADGRDITLWLTAWGGHERRLAEIEAEWSRLLARLYPEGEAP
ncbi:MAG: SRPBCC domain-containing protein [Gemmatimonadota bacterium]